MQALRTLWSTYVTVIPSLFALHFYSKFRAQLLNLSLCCLFVFVSLVLGTLALILQTNIGSISENMYLITKGVLILFENQ